ncbi:MAG: ATP-binding cassette domain-containing protein [Lachnospiraceae bacterium]|nr:ATP-binding cassette domain-containing protein [Lachnospiraceae bacterium]
MSLDVNIKKQYPGFALDVSFKTGSKRIGILGASGCGKSITLKSIAGIEKPDSGRISFENSVWFDKEKGVNIKAARRNVGYLFQNYALFPNMTVKENIEAALHVAGKDKNRAGSSAEIIERYALSDIKDHMPDELSGGQQQRTAFARLMARDPGMILLDEPFSAMDTFLREGMRLELIRMLDEYDKTVIMVSHDRDEIYQMCDYLILMDKGRVIAKGDTDELFSHPKTTEAARLTGCKNISRIKRMSDHRIKALDWQGIELLTDETVTEDITHAGVRAHDIVPGDEGVNVFSAGRAQISRLPFEWYVTLENGLWWKRGRELYDTGDESIVPEYLSIPPEKIILMKNAGS